MNTLARPNRGKPNAPLTLAHPPCSSEMTAQHISRAPVLLTPAEVAAALRTSRKAIYAMIARHQLPGIVRLGRRVLVRQDALLDWLSQKSTPSLER
jgi:excisionase family DNA binding protein